MLLLVPADPLGRRRPDEHFGAEADAAREAGWRVALVDHEALQGGRAEESVRRVPDDDDVVYRGWMVTSDQYDALDRALRERDAVLRTTPAQYRRAHELPGWYLAMKPLTPLTVRTVGDDLDELAGCCRRLGEGAAVLRDHTKSMKHYWDTAAYVPDVTDVAATTRVAETFRTLRGSDFDGGFVLRRFEAFGPTEVRTWWRDGTCVASTAHPDTPDALEPVPGVFLRAVADRLRGLGLAFATADLVRRDDGVWRVVELGDGQVSDRPRSLAPADLVDLLAPSAAEPHPPVDHGETTRAVVCSTWTLSALGQVAVLDLLAGDLTPRATLRETRTGRSVTILHVNPCLGPPFSVQVAADPASWAALVPGALLVGDG